MNRKTLTSVGAQLSLTLLTPLLIASQIAGCTQIQSALNNSSCTTHAEGFQAATAQEGVLSEAVATPEPYPMALVFSQTAVNELFAAIAGVDIPAIPLNFDALGVPVTITLYPDLPLIQFGQVQGACATCIILGTSFGLDVEVSGLGVVGGRGDSLFSFPLNLQDASDLAFTSVNAQMDQAAFVQGSLNIEITGVDDSIMNIAEPFIEAGLNILVTETFGETHLFDLDSWDIGDGDVKLLARGPHIHAEHETIVIGMHTNLFDIPMETITPDPDLPDNFDLGMQFHPALIEMMIGRLMHEGHIERNYNETGQKDAQGDHQMSLNFMQSAEVMKDGTPSNLLRTGFRLWRTGGSLCGWADMQADFGLSISDAEMKLDVQNFDVTDGAGFGELFKVAFDSWSMSPYTADLINFSQLTINYRELDLPNNMQADLDAESFILSLDARGLNVFLNITNIFGIEEEGE